jgi:hypothetical protein
MQQMLQMLQLQFMHFAAQIAATAAAAERQDAAEGLHVRREFAGIDEILENDTHEKRLRFSSGFLSIWD